MLGPRARVSDPERIRAAGSIVLCKRDNIGDFILATTFLNVAYREWRGRDVTLVCSPVLLEMAGLLYPEWKLRTAVDDDPPRNYGGSWRNPSELQRRVTGWPRTEVFVSLRSIRHQNEVIFDSWVPAAAKVAVRNQFHYEAGEYIKVRDSRVYSVVVPGQDEPTPEVCRDIANQRRLVRFFFPGVDADTCWPSLDFMGRDAQLAESGARRGGDCRGRLVLCPFPSSEVRAYPQDKLIEVVRRVATKHSLGVAVIGGEKDRAVARRIADSLARVPGGASSLAGDLSIAESVMAIRSAPLVIGVDTGPMHMAIASRTPSVVLLGGGHYGTFGPWGGRRLVRWLSHPMPCYDCNWRCSRAEPYCVRSIEPGAIEAAADAVLGERQTDLQTS